MYEYLADLRFDTTVDTCFSVIRCKDGILEGYHASTDTWESNPRLADIYIGELDVEKISEEKAQEIIKRLKRDYGKKLG